MAKGNHAIHLKCQCGGMLRPMYVSGEVSTTAVRSCPCGLKMYIELAFDRWEKRAPKYRLEKLSVL